MNIAKRSPLINTGRPSPRQDIVQQNDVDALQHDGNPLKKTCS